MLSDVDQSRLANLNRVWSADIRAGSAATKALYRPYLGAASNEGITVVRDLAYGPDDRHRLDVFLPFVSGRCAPLPVLAFVHGGAFVRGEKSSADGLYDNVLFWFAKQGVIGVNIEYRLAPQACFPAGAEDVGAALGWIRSHIASYGGNPTRCVLMGHSAGGTHVSDYVFRVQAATHGLQPAAVVLVSARLRADVLPVNPNREGVRAYYAGSAPELLEARSALSALRPCDVPVMILIAETENPLLDVYAFDYADRLARVNQRTTYVRQVAGHNHMSIVAHLNSGDDDLGYGILNFLRDHAILA